MKKIFKIAAILLVVAAIVCVAGCSSKNTANNTQSIASQNITESTATAVITAENTTTNVTAAVNNSTGLPA